jgi:hypothetical protein
MITNKKTLTMNNYFDVDGVPQPHIDGEPQQDFVYDYYISRDITPPWFEDYRQKTEDISVNWEHVSKSFQDGRTKDETAYLIRKYVIEHGSLERCPYNYNALF